MRIVLIHGTKGSPESNWIPWLCQELETNGHRVICPKLPTPENQSIESWIEAFDNQVGELTEQDILVGHSMGVGFILRLLERGASVKGIILVSGFTDILGIPEYDQLNSSLIKKPFDWSTILQNTEHVSIFAGDKDPYIPFSQTQKLEQNLKVEATIFIGGGHLNSESGYTEFEELKEEILKII